MSTTRNFFQAKDTDEALKSKAFGGVKFGLNTGHLVKMECVRTEKDGAELYSVNTHVMFGENEQKSFLAVTPGRMIKSGDSDLHPGDEGYDDALFDDLVQKIAVIKHQLKAVGVADTTIDQVSATLNPDDILGGIAALVGLFPANAAQKEVDVFLEYQWNIKGQAKQTYPELPKNMKSGAFMVPSVKPIGEWKEVRTATLLEYVDNQGNKHPFTRSGESYLSGNKANPQFLDGHGPANNPKPAGFGAFGSQSASANPAVEAKKSLWGSAPQQ